MESEPPAEQDKKRSNTTSRRQDDGLPGLWYLFSGRRKELRREEDIRESHFLDHFGFYIFSIIIGIILLSLTDAMLTLYLIRSGAAEINPVMEHFLEYGTLPFLAAKYLLTTASVILLLIYKNFRLFGTTIRAKHLFIVILLIFISVVLWELYLIFYALE